MTERPILMSAPMVRALLAGRKTQTRRVIPDAPEGMFMDRVGPTGFQWTGPGGLPRIPFRPRIAVGDVLRVKHAADVFPVYFKPITGWERSYAAGTDGLIYRIDGSEPSALSGSPTSKGYLAVALSNGTWHTKNVHRLICEAFYGPPPFAGAQARHLDGDLLNNRPENLDWGTQSQNWQDRKAHGRSMGTAHHSAKLSNEAVELIRASAESQRVLAKRFGVTQSAIWRVKHGHTRAEHEPAPRNAPAFALWRSPIFMPRWASRLSLLVTDVRIERLQDISEVDAVAEGVRPFASSGSYISPPHRDGKWRAGDNAYEMYRDLWNDINGAGSWATNPWVVAYTFEAIPSPSLSGREG